MKKDRAKGSREAEAGAASPIEPLGEFQKQVVVRSRAVRCCDDNTQVSFLISHKNALGNLSKQSLCCGGGPMANRRKLGDNREDECRYDKWR